MVLRVVVDGARHHAYQPVTETVLKKGLVCCFDRFCQLGDVIGFPVPRWERIEIVGEGVERVILIDQCFEEILRTADFLHLRIDIECVDVFGA